MEELPEDAAILRYRPEAVQEYALVLPPARLDSVAHASPLGAGLSPTKTDTPARLPEPEERTTVESWRL